MTEHERTVGQIKGTYGAAPELVGVRESIAGSERMMVFPFHSTHTWRNFNHFAFNDAMMLKGDGTHPSDGLRLFLNGCKVKTKRAVCRTAFCRRSVQVSGFGGLVPEA